MDRGLPDLEIAHVLFVDIVGYSQRLPGEQAASSRELQEHARATDEFQRAEARGELIGLPLGDGVALVFFRDPAAPLRCAEELWRRLQSGSTFSVRMGIHSGPVHRVEDINANLNVAGGGINLAQRVMECGDSGHILVSAATASLLKQLGHWQLVDLGEAEAKHGERLRVFNFAEDGVGNCALPQRFASPSVKRARDAAAEAASPSLARVCLLYKRGAQPDEDVLRSLERDLRAAGCSVFVDRHMVVGVEWAREIEAQIRQSDAVVCLISEAAIPSEMLGMELEIAQDASAQQGGRPRILPIRIRYEGPLPEHLARILDPIEYALWRGPDDGSAITRGIREALAEGGGAREPARSALAASVTPSELESVGGAVPLDSRFYIERGTDEQFCSAVERGDSIVLVKGARQMGKTSLLARGLQRARQAGSRVVSTDFQKLNQQHLASVTNLYLALAGSLADQLDSDVWPEDVFDERRGPSVNFERYVRRHALQDPDARLVWGLDEVDRLFSCEFGSEVFGLFRSWHNERSLDPSGPWSRVTLAIAYATEAHLFITDVNQSPFNVGTRVALEDFTFGQVAELNERHSCPLHGEAELARFVRLVSGHPYLVRRGLYQMVTNGLTVDGFASEADREEGPFGDHLRRYLVLIAANEPVCDSLRQVLRGQGCASADHFYRLRSVGLLAGESPRDARPRCQVYTTFLERYLF